MLNITFQETNVNPFKHFEFLLISIDIPCVDDQSAAIHIPFTDLLSPTVKSKYSAAARKYKLFAGESSVFDH